MKGIAPLLVGAILAMAAGAGLIAANMLGDTSIRINGTNETVPGPAEIGADAAATFPVNDFVDYFLGGFLGVLRWLAIHLMTPAASWVATMAVGQPVILPNLVGYLLLAFLIVLFFMWKWEAIWSFVWRNAIIVLILLGVIFVLGVSLTMLGAI